MKWNIVLIKLVGLFASLRFPVLLRIIQHLLVIVSDRQWELPDHKCSLTGSRGSRRGGASRVESAESSSSWYNSEWHDSFSPYSVLCGWSWSPDPNVGVVAQLIDRTVLRSVCQRLLGGIGDLFRLSGQKLTRELGGGAEVVLKQHPFGFGFLLRQAFYLLLL